MILDQILGIEGRYSNDPRDSGGETVYGISRKYWPNWPGWVIVDALKAQPGFPRSLDASEALKQLRNRFYKQFFWDRFNGDELAELSPPIAAELMDIEVNCQPGLAARALQRALNALNDPSGGTDSASVMYPELEVDGLIGPVTLNALQTLLAVRKRQGEVVLLRMLNVQQGAHYMELVERREKDKAFVYGWFLRRIELQT